jgi:lysophospholipase L1-like esterase
MANDIDKTSPHYKGEFGSIYEVNQKFPNGGVAGDYVEIDGWAHYWNADRGTWCVNAQRDSYWDELITGIIEKFKLFKGATYMGVAGLDTVPAKAIGAKMYYFATVAGTYKSFGGLVVPQGINVLYSENGSSWVCSTLLEVAQELGVSTRNVVSQKVVNDALNLKANQSSVNEALAKKADKEEMNRLLATKANTADVNTKFTEEKKRIDAELSKKFDKESVAQESGDSEVLVMSQKAVSTKLSDISEKSGYIAQRGIYNIDDVLFDNTYLKENDVVYIDFAPTVDSGAISFESTYGKELFYITKEVSKVVIPANFKQAKVKYGSIRLNKDVESLTNRIINNTIESFKIDISEQRLESINIGSNRGTYINASGQKIQTEEAYSKYYLSDKISIVEGEDIFVTASSNFGNALYCIYGNNDEVIKKELSKAGSDVTSIENKKITIPKGSVYILLAWISDSLPGKLSRLHTYTKDYLSICDNFTKAKVPSHFIVKSGKLLNADGKEYEPDPASDNFRISSHISVTPGEIICVTGCAFWGQAIFSIFDASDNVIFKINSTSGTGTATKIFDKEVVVPANGSYCIVSWNLSDSMYGAVKKEKILPKSPFINKKWACIGDSWTDNRNANPKKRYFDFISEETGITPIMMGYSGSGYAKLGQFSFYNRAKQLPVDTDVVTIFGSGNDLSSELPLGNITDNGTDTICGCINTAINNILSVNPIIQIGIISPCPWKDYKDTQEKWDNYCKALEQIAKSRSIPYLDLIHCSGLRPWNDKARQLTFVDDGVHPNEKGHKIFSSQIREFLKKIL